MPKLTVESILYLVLILCTGFLLLFGYQYAKSQGRQEVQAKWDKEKADRKAAIVTEQLKQAGDQAVHKTTSKEIDDALAKAKEGHDAALSILRRDYDKRLLQSENRAGIYKRQAESGALECQRLASHASELDRSLEEGRSLVRELRETLGQRDQQVSLLGQQILADRKLFNESQVP